MPRGSKSKYTSKQKRKAEKIEKGYKSRGVSKDEAERRAWATVNKVDKGGKKSSSGKKARATNLDRGGGSAATTARSQRTRTKTKSGRSRK
jgi:hypothetical protein